MDGIPGGDGLNQDPATPVVYDRQVEVFLAVLHRRWPAMGRTARILDLGCGAGDMVRLLRQRGYLAWGSDLEAPNSGDADLYLALEPSTGQIATGDGTFDVVISNQVLEHVMDLPAVFREIRRILRPGGVSLHAFPSRWSLVEQHVNVPWGGVFRSRAYLRFWARLGVRNGFQAGHSSEQVAELNFNYLREHTNYPSQRRLRAVIDPHFQNYTFVERDFLAGYADLAGLPSWKRWAIRGVLSLHLEGLYRLVRARALWLQG